VEEPAGRSASVVEVPKPEAPGGKPARTNYYDDGRLIIATSPEGGKIGVYDKESRKTHIVTLAAPKDSSITITPIVGPGAVALMIKGPKITRIAAASSLTGQWYPQDLLEPVAGEAMPLVGPRVVAYGLGRHVYAFSPEARRWGIARLPEGTSAAPIVGAGAVTVQAAGHILTFNLKTGEWDDLDINAIFDKLDAKDAGDATPKK
jgi:hypothetical protein